MSKHRKRENVANKIEIADELFSQVVRLKGMDHTGYCWCYTCGKGYHFKDIDCGHFVSRKEIMTRWLEENARPQCRKCNRHLAGMPERFEDLLEQQNPGIVEHLKELARQTANLTRGDMDRIIESLRKRLKELGGLKSVPQQ